MEADGSAPVSLVSHRIPPMSRLLYHAGAGRVGYNFFPKSRWNLGIFPRDSRLP
jgi:hypothetical protein